MFSHQERIKAVKLLVQYDMSYAGVIRELGYPTRTALTGWYKEYAKDNDLHERFVKRGPLIHYHSHVRFEICRLTSVGQTPAILYEGNIKK